MTIMLHCSIKSRMEWNGMEWNVDAISKKKRCGNEMEGTDLYRIV